MRRIAFTLTLFFLTLSLSAQTVWTVKTVPNTRLESNEIHVSDPDGFLSDSAEMNINNALCAIRDKADVFVVTLATIGEAEPKHFATDLFNDWGIGDAETNNGVLLLFVEDQHALEFETGYGAEATLTDAKCQRIFTNTIVPFFKAGNYESGLCAGVGEIVGVYGGEIPAGLKATLPGTDNGGESDFSGKDLLKGFLGLAIIFLFPFIGVIFYAAKAKTKSPLKTKETLQSVEEDGVHYVSGLKTSWSGSPWDGKGCAGGLMIGFSFFIILGIVLFAVLAIYPNMSTTRQCVWSLVIALPLYLTWVCFRHNRRMLKTAKKLAQNSINPKSVYQAAYNHSSNKLAMWIAPWIGWIFHLILKRKVNETEEDCLCPTCGAALNPTKIFMLPDNHAAEQRLGVMNFTPYRCVNGHTYVVKEKGPEYIHFVTCEKCGAMTAKKLKEVTTRAASYSHQGEKELTYECQHCAAIYTSILAIPMLVHASSSSSSSSSGRSHSSGSSHHSGGSFGGGHSGGGGFSGRW